MLPLLFAFLTPFFWALRNVIDSYVMVHKVKHPLGFAMMTGVISIVISIILAFFIPFTWGVKLLLPFVSGTFLGLQALFYFTLMKNEDASSVIGFLYLYPLGIALLSFLVLKEVIPVYGYLGMVLSIIGAVLLSPLLRLPKHPYLFLRLFVVILLIVCDEFLAKIANIQLPLLQNLILYYAGYGFVLLFCFLKKSYRKKFQVEVHNVPWALGNECISLVAIFTFFSALAALPVTIVTSLSALQPLFVLLMGPKVKHGLFKKAEAITFIVLGAILLGFAVP